MITKYKSEIYRRTQSQGGEFEEKSTTETFITNWGCSKKSDGVALQGGSEGLSVKGITVFQGVKIHKVKKGDILKTQGEEFIILSVDSSHPRYMKVEAEVM